MMDVRFGTTLLITGMKHYKELVSARQHQQPDWQLDFDLKAHQIEGQITVLPDREIVLTQNGEGGTEVDKEAYLREFGAVYNYVYHIASNLPDTLPAKSSLMDKLDDFYLKYVAVPEKSGEPLPSTIEFEG